jgi:hypothetical protein
MARKVSEIALELADREAIRDCLMLYPRAVDRIDLDILPGYCWPEATEDHAGVFKGAMVDFFPVVESLVRQTEVAQHFQCNTLIEIDGARARTETYVFAYQGMNENDVKFTFLAGGRILGVFEKRDDEWRIIERTILVDWVKNIPDPAGSLEDPLAHSINGTRAPHDLSMSHFKRIFA